jgi:hypothetical protein
MVGCAVVGGVSNWTAGAGFGLCGCGSGASIRGLLARGCISSAEVAMGRVSEISEAMIRAVLSMKYQYYRQKVFYVANV